MGIFWGVGSGGLDDGVDTELDGSGDVFPSGWSNNKSTDDRSRMGMCGRKLGFDWRMRKMEETLPRSLGNG